MMDGLQLARVVSRGGEKKGDCLLVVRESHMWVWDGIYSTTIEYTGRFLGPTSIR